MINQNINIALGNPNTGKTSVFNQLTGLNQQVGIIRESRLRKKIVNYPITLKVNILDLPGTYSNASSIDENVVLNYC
jgi:ferrous iron transport protein B